MNNVISYIILFISITGYSQKKLIKEIPVADTIETIYLDFNNVFLVTVATHKYAHIKVESQSEGEYANNFVLQNKIERGSMLLSGSVSFGILYPQDKLSAHKVHAVSVHVSIPKDKQIVLTSDIANVTIKGVYQSVFLNLYSGNVTAKELQANTIIQTVNGDIQLALKKGRVQTFSKYGKVVQEEIPEGTLNYKLKTLKGNINIQTIR